MSNRELADTETGGVPYNIQQRERQFSCTKRDLKVDGPLEEIRKGLGNEYEVFKMLHGDAFLRYDIIVFSEARGPLLGLMQLAADHRYLSFRTDQDAQNFSMLVFWSPGVDVPLGILQYVIDLRPQYEELQQLYRLQMEIEAPSVHIDIGPNQYDVDLREFDFSVVPPIRYGVHVENARIYQYILSGPMSPRVRATVLAKLMYFSQAVKAAADEGYAYIGDANLPSDLTLYTVSGGAVNAAVIASRSAVSTPLNGGSTIRLTELDILGRRKLGFPGWKLERDVDVEYLADNRKHVAEFYFAHNCSSALAEFGPKLEDDAAARITEELWNPEYVAAIAAARQRDVRGRYDEINQMWATFFNYLSTRGVPFEDIVKLIYEEDHVRVNWTMSW